MQYSRKTISPFSSVYVYQIIHRLQSAKSALS